MRKVRVAVAGLMLACAWGLAVAQGSGGLRVQVLDAHGDPLPGATVTLRHDTGQSPPHMLLSDEKGSASFPVLRPGSGYVVEVALPGFAGRRESDIRVPLGQEVRLRIQLTEEIQERVRAVNSDAVVDLEQSSSTRRFGEQFVQDLPVQGRLYQNVLSLAPGVQDPDGDGNPTVHGSRSRNFRAEVAGVSNVDPLTGRFMSLVNADSIEEMEVVTAGAGVEFGRAQGGFARILQKSGTNTFEGTVGVLYRSSKLDGSGANDFSRLPDPEFEQLQPSVHVSGPIVRDRLWYRLSHEVMNAEEPINVVSGIEIQTTRQGIHSDQLTWQVSPRNRLAFQFQADPLRIENFGVDSTTPPESALTLDTRTRTYSLIWTAPVSPKLLVESTVAWQDQESTLAPATTGVANDCVDEGSPFMERTLCTNLETQENSGSHFRTLDAHTQRLTVRSQATLYGGRFWGATHQFKFGFAVENERFVQDLEDRPRLLFYILELLDPEASTTPEQIPIVQATVSAPSVTAARSTGTNWALYLEDQLKIRSNLVLTLGARLDREEIVSNGMSPFDPVAEGQAYLDQLAAGIVPLDSALRQAFTAYEAVDRFTLDVSRATGIDENILRAKLAPITLQSTRWRKRSLQGIAIANTNLSPFLSLAWDPWGDGRNKFAVSARRYYDKIFLGIPLIESFPATTRLEFTGFRRDDGTLLVCENCLRTSVNPAVNVEVVDRNLRTPYQDEFRLLYERELWSETLLRAEYINRRYRDQFQNADVNHRPDDFGRCRLPDFVHPAAIVESPGASDAHDRSTWLADPYSGQLYPDTDPGIGDGRLDDCTGEFVTFQGHLNEPLSRPDGLNDLYTQNPGWQQVFLVGNFNRSDYEAFVIELIRRQYRSWEMQASYTWSMSQGNGEDFRQFFLGIDPNLLESESGFQSNDQRHVFKLTATTITSWGLRLGGTARWQSGLPYSVILQSPALDLVPAPYRINVFSPARPRWSYPSGVRNSERNDSQWRFDLKLTKELAPGRRTNLQLSLEVFNLLDDDTYQVYNPALETGRQINGRNQARREFGRRWQLGLRVNF